ncbi:hypothetical protein Zmor_001128 [Zophobas morio]|uniref:Ionotropic glutamate receptor C-terminal domain-containing protein n=1 Tax=Zophobas morio TaxID=2755281 RepID=A0AA38IYD9_9CUCU|nr:hypothetical protein Zmor_001128 [Zophobas morio]
MMGTNFTVSYVVAKPDYPFDVTDYRYRHIDNYSKLNYNTISYLLEMLNFTTIFIQRDSWGYKAPNASHFEGGMFGDLETGSAELGGTVSYYTADRLNIVEYVSIQSPIEVKFILKAPPLSNVRNLFTLPFEANVWFCLSLVSAVTVFILYVVVMCEEKYRQNFKKYDIVEYIKPKFLDVAMVQIGCCTQQGSDTEPRSSSGRIILLIMLLLMMFFYTAYSASIVVLLQSTSNSITTVYDLLYSKIELGVEDIVYSRYYFESQQEPVRKAIYDTKVAAKGRKANFMSMQIGIKKMRDEFFAFHAETSAAYKVVMDLFQEHEKCGLTEIDYLNHFRPTITMRKKSPFKDHIKVGFRKIHESGIHHRQINRICSKKPQCTSQRGTFVNVGFIDAYFPILIFCIGIVSSGLLLLIEIIVKKYY